MFAPLKQYISSKTTLNEDDYAKIEAVCIYKKLRKRQYLLKEGDVWKYNCFIVKGLLRFYNLDDNG